MRILLDECVDRRLNQFITGHEVKTAQQMGWRAIKNGELLTLAEKDFDVFLTVDRNLAFQQPITKFSISVVVMRAPTNRLSDLEVLVPELLSVLPSTKKGEVHFIGSDKSS